MTRELHFISHSHWDREWYMSFEHHRFRLVEFMDKLIDAFENNPDFKYFHLDGQIIILEDYLEIKPYMFERLKKVINDGKLKIGPWYILQDEFLISGEANIRNLLYGIKLGRKYGPVSMIGYFPDAFGNISQIPQILKGFGIQSAVFGRGINPVGCNNTIVDCSAFKQYNSELIWRSLDGSEVLGILFANWYHNAMELPAEKQETIKRIMEARDNAAAVAATPYVLMMNGCDHQPVQANLPEVLAQVRNEFAEELIHSNFEIYINKVEEYRNQLQVAEGELTGQHTDGAFTLVNTASSRIYLKQLNHKAQNLLEKWAEPMGVMSFINGGEYRSDFLWKAWQYLLQNHPHDSICGCSIDDVHEEMVVRYKKSIAIAEELIDRELHHLISKMDTSCFKNDEIPVVIFNPCCWDVTELVSTFADFDENESVDIGSIYVLDLNGKEISANIMDKGKTFTYTLPEDSFRKVRYVRRLEVKFCAENVPGLGYTTYVIKKEKLSDKSELNYGRNYAENRFLKVEILDNGALKVTDKESGNVFHNLNTFEDSGDVGDEYNFVSPAEDKIILSQDSTVNLSIYETGKASVTFKIEHTLELPVSADKTSNKRKGEPVQFNICSYVTLSEKARRVDISSEFDNIVCDHRLRALFQTDIQSDVCYADGQFDVIKREIKPWKGWINKSNCQRQQAFVEICDGTKGLIIANKGLPEYEVLRDGKNTIALTLVRSVGELGDWGYFPTPGAQCQGIQKVEYSIIPFEGEQNRILAYRNAYQFSITPFKTRVADLHKGELNLSDAVINMKGNNVILSCLKKSEEQDGVIVRIYNPGFYDELVEIDLNPRFNTLFEVNMNEERQKKIPLTDYKAKINFPSKKILTFELNKMKGGLCNF